MFQPNQFRFNQPENQDQEYSPVLRGLGVSVTGLAAWSAHKHLLRTDPRYARRLYDWASKFEELSPFRIGRTFALSERFSSYLPSTLTFARHDLISQREFTRVGSHLQRLIDRTGAKFDVRSAAEAGGLAFERADAGSAYLLFPSRGPVATLSLCCRPAAAEGHPNSTLTST